MKYATLLLIVTFSVNPVFSQLTFHNKAKNNNTQSNSGYYGSEEPFFLYKFIPGIYQLKKAEFKKGLAFTTASISWSLFYYNSVKSKPVVQIPQEFPYYKTGDNYYFRDYPISKQEYDAGISDITTFLKNDREYLDARSRYDKKITLYQAAGITLYSLHMIDAFLIPVIREKRTSRRVYISQQLREAQSSYSVQNYRKTKDILVKLLHYDNIENGILEEIYLYSSLAEFKEGKTESAENYLERLLTLNPGKEFDASLLTKEFYELIEKVRTERFGSLFISTGEENADAYINGEIAGSTPLTVDYIPVGTYKIGIISAGSDLVEKNVTVLPSQTTKFDTVLTPMESLGVLIINSDPQVADINVNGYYIGETPLTLEDQPPGYYKIRLEKLKCHPREEIHALKNGDTTRVMMNLRTIKDYFIYSELVPGLSQWITGHPFRGSFWMLATLGWAYKYREHGKTRPEVFYYSNDQLWESNGLYYIGTTEISKEEYDNEIEKILRSNKSQNNMEKWERERDTYIAAGVGIYVLNLIDTYIIFKSGNKKAVDLAQSKLNYNLYSHANSFGIQLYYTF